MKLFTLAYATALLAAPFAMAADLHYIPIRMCRDNDGSESCVTVRAGAGVSDYASSDIPPDYVGNIKRLGIAQKLGSCNIPCDEDGCTDKLELTEQCKSYTIGDSEKTLISKATRILCKYDSEADASAEATTCSIG